MKNIKLIVSFFILFRTAKALDVKTQLNEGLAPLAIAPGTPSGSYRLNNFETFNLYNGKVSVTLPLLDIGGRVRAATTALGTSPDVILKIKRAKP